MMPPSRRWTPTRLSPTPTSNSVGAWAQTLARYHGGGVADYLQLPPAVFTSEIVRYLVAIARDGADALRREKHAPDDRPDADPLDRLIARAYHAATRRQQRETRVKATRAKAQAATLAAQRGNAAMYFAAMDGTP